MKCSSSLLLALALVSIEIALRDLPWKKHVDSSFAARDRPSPPPPLPPGAGRLTTSASCKCAECPRLRTLAYPLPEWWPLPPLPLVMETRPRECDLCWADPVNHPNPCELMSSRATWAPAPPVREALVAALLPCAFAPGSCAMLDLGGNLGVFSLWAWAMGANVVFVEPQGDLVRAFEGTVDLNCARDSITVHHAGVTTVESQNGTKYDFGNGYRQCDSETFATTRGTETPGVAPFVFVDELFTRQPQWSLVKIDIDADDVEILKRALSLIERGQLSVRSFIIEWNSGRGEGDVISRLHAQNYSIYALNIHDGRRHFNEQGFDVISSFLPIATEPYLEEVYMQRAIRFAFKVRKGRSAAEYNELLFFGQIPEFFITKDVLEEPSIENTRKVGRRPFGRAP